MPSAALKLVALMLLIAQAAIFVLPGRVICIQTRDCDTHGHGAQVACEHHVAAQISGVVAARGGLGFNPVSAVFHPPDDCGCHAHLPVSSDGQAPINPRGGSPEPRTYASSPAAALVLDRGGEPPCGASPHPPDGGTPAHLRAIKTTRLLI